MPETATDKDLRAVQELQLARLRLRLEDVNAERQQLIQAIDNLKAAMGLGACCGLYELTEVSHSYYCEKRK